jgi:hypothetical protein
LVVELFEDVALAAVEVKILVVVVVKILVLEG